jgi:NodT family efflux transporter outer membrane factor (OMF) lipoprotein
MHPLGGRIPDSRHPDSGVRAFRARVHATRGPVAKPFRFPASLLAGAAACALLQGCATGEVRKPDVHTPVAYEAPQPDKAAPAEALDHWWTLYDDAQLSGLVEEALKNSPDAKDAFSKLAQAIEVRRSALYSYNPQGNLSASVSKPNYTALNPSRPNPNSLFTFNPVDFLGIESSSLSLPVTWELDLWGRRRTAGRQADADLLTARFTYDATRWSLAAGVADSLFQARGLAIQLDQANQTLRIQQQLYDVSKARTDHGLSPLSDTAQTLANVQAAQSQVQEFTAQLGAARRQLLLLVGRGVDPLASLPMAAEVGAPPAVPAAIPGELLVRRPDVREAEERVVSASARLALNKKALLPTLQLQPSAGLTQQGSGPNSQFSYWTIAAGLTTPVLDRPRLLSQVRQQREVAEQAVIAYEKAVQTAYSDAEQAFGYYDSDKKRVALLTEAEKNANFAYRAKEEGYSRGLNDLQTALTAEANWRQARLALAQAQVSVMQRSVQVFKALGGGWSLQDDAAASKVAAR